LSWKEVLEIPPFADVLIIDNCCGLRQETFKAFGYLKFHGARTGIFRPTRAPEVQASARGFQPSDRSDGEWYRDPLRACGPDECVVHIEIDDGRLWQA
jgi:hypothetical protein